MGPFGPRYGWTNLLLGSKFEFSKNQVYLAVPSRAKTPISEHQRSPPLRSALAKQQPPPYFLCAKSKEGILDFTDAVPHGREFGLPNRRFGPTGPTSRISEAYGLQIKSIILVFPPLLC